MADANDLDLDRFVEAQAGMWTLAMSEVRAGRKETHWMWFVYPQLRGLGTSAAASHFGIRGLLEADAYVEHPVLGPRLSQSVQAVMDSPQRDMQQLFGNVDALKLQSCLTLFEHCEPTQAVCAAALDRCFAGVRDKRSLEILKVLARRS